MLCMVLCPLVILNIFKPICLFFPLSALQKGECDSSAEKLHTAARYADYRRYFYQSAVFDKVLPPALYRNDCSSH